MQSKPNGSSMVVPSTLLKNYLNEFSFSSISKLLGYPSWMVAIQKLAMASLYVPGPVKSLGL